ncbi:putative E3 ubiquitin-protein ligase RFWD3 [Hypsibius exemplaris]|uniref:RING-type E3 ubiquitin transferase n=1 Tax=Hypsibius exemplaris TaxID=2072580 RepID=A0A1W0X795_HYPEX|nr:putative E3 ubiquitin-protein ligase RFWD3 [Hypsibius exemplaris]
MSVPVYHVISPRYEVVSDGGNEEHDVITLSGSDSDDGSSESDADGIEHSPADEPDRPLRTPLITEDVAATESSNLVESVRHASVRERTDSGEDELEAAEVRRKRQRLDPVAGPSTSTSTGKEEDRNAAEECTICFDPITTNGDHRPACLVCGHIFGLHCIKKWLSQPEREKRLCPQCKTKAKEQDIRLLFLSKTAICLVDNSELEGARNGLKQAKEELRRTKMQQSSMENDQRMAKLQIIAANEENRRLARELEDAKLLVEEFKRQVGVVAAGSTTMAAAAAAATVGTPQITTNAAVKYGLVLELMRDYKEASARVMAFYQAGHRLVISQKLNAANHGPFGGGSGLKMVSCLDFNTTEVMPLNTGLIRDICVNEANGNTLIGSMDKSLLLVNLNQKSVIHKYQEDFAVWSVAWNRDDSKYFYCGLADGSVSVYDIRYLAGRVNRLSREGSGNPPVFQLTHMERRHDHKFSPSGLVVSSTNRCGFYTSSSPSLDQHEFFDFEQMGSQFATTFDRPTRMIARSYRPHASCQFIRHSMEEFSHSLSTSPKIQLNTLHSVSRGALAGVMYRGTFLSLCGRADESSADNLRLAMPDQSSCSVLLWDLMDRNPKQTLKTPQLPLDLCAFVNNGRPLTAVLMENGLQVYASRAMQEFVAAIIPWRTVNSMPKMTEVTAKLTHWRFEYVWPDEFTAEIATAPVFTARIRKKQDIPTVLSLINEQYPLPELKHLKRIRRPPASPDHPDEPQAEIIVKWAGIEYNDGATISTALILQDVPVAERLLSLLEPVARVALVSQTRPLTKHQLASSQKLWPTCNINPIVSVDTHAFEAHHHRSHADFMDTLITGYDKARFEEETSCFRNVVMLVDSRGTVIHRPGSSRPETSGNPLNHSVLRAINYIAETQQAVCVGKRRTPDDEDASAEADSYLCTECTAYLLREPCVMCAMALIHARISRVIFLQDGRTDGALKSIFKLQGEKQLNHHFEVWQARLPSEPA